MKNSGKKVNRFIYWTPRILGIIFVLFLALFSLDVFEGNYGFWGTLLGLFMHNIPSMILLVIIIISWKHELVGAIAFFLAGFLYILLILLRPNFELFRMFWILPISAPAFIIGYLFYLNYRKRKNSS